LFLSARNNRKLGTPLIVLGAIVVVALILVTDRIPRPLISAGFLSPAFAAIIYGLALRPNWTTLLENRVLVLLGDASYSLYLLHSIVIQPVYERMVFLPWALRVVVALLAAIAASVLSFYLVEEPCRKLLRPKRRSGE
jgi:exopolysaccharide production protein ExoZ